MQIRGNRNGMKLCGSACPHCFILLEFIAMWMQAVLTLLYKRDILQASFLALLEFLAMWMRSALTVLYTRYLLQASFLGVGVPGHEDAV